MLRLFTSTGVHTNAVNTFSFLEVYAGDRETISKKTKISTRQDGMLILFHSI